MSKTQSTLEKGIEHYTQHIEYVKDERSTQRLTRSDAPQEYYEDEIIINAAMVLDEMLDDDDYLMTNDVFRGCINLNLGTVEEPKYKLLGEGGQFIVYEGYIDESKLSYESYLDMWTHIKAFELMNEDLDGNIDRIDRYTRLATAEIKIRYNKMREYIENNSKRKLSKKKLEKRIQEHLVNDFREEILQRRHRKDSIFPGGICAVKIQSTPNPKATIKESQMCGYVDQDVVFMPIVGVSVLDLPGRKPFNRAYMIMEYVDAMSPKEVRENKTLYDKIRHAKRALSFIEKARKINITHRDIKPENILITEKGAVKICDFGAIRIYKSDGKTFDPSKSIGSLEHYIVGTPDYFAPEQVATGLVDFRTDQYGLCGTIYNWLVKEPFNPVYDNIDNPQIETNYKTANAAAPPSMKIKPVDPRNAIKDSVKYKGLEGLTSFFDRLLTLPWKKRQIDRDLGHIALVLAKGMQHNQGDRYQENKEMEEDFDSVLNHSLFTPPNVAKYLKENKEKLKNIRKENKEKIKNLRMEIEQAKIIREKEERNERIKEKEEKIKYMKEKENNVIVSEYQLIRSVFSIADPLYEHWRNNPNTRKEKKRMRWKNRLKLGIAALAAGTIGYYIGSHKGSIDNVLENLTNPPAVDVDK